MSTTTGGGEFGNPLRKFKLVFLASKAVSVEICETWTEKRTGQVKGCYRRIHVTNKHANYYLTVWTDTVVDMHLKCRKMYRKRCHEQYTNRHHVGIEHPCSIRTNIILERYDIRLLTQLCFNIQRTCYLYVFSLSVYVFSHVDIEGSHQVLVLACLCCHGLSHNRDLPF